MRIRSGQLVYKVRDVTGRWIKKVEYPNVTWTESEAEAHIFRKLHHLRAEMSTGVLNPSNLQELLDGLPPEAVEVVEYELTIKKKRKHRLTEISKFYSNSGTEDQDVTG